MKLKNLFSSNNILDMMINKDNPDVSDDDIATKDEQIYYIPRVNGNGKKRGAILSWALPANRM